MIPSVLAQQLRQGISDFVETTFPVSTPLFHGMVERLLDEDGGVFKEPYLSIELPFLPGTAGADFFPNVPLPFPPYLHQERAFERLSGPRPRSTIIATGTGSGKTESFLWPILDHCYRHRSEPGIKAILVYPMNALATDQAMRTARAIHGNAKLRSQVIAGLYIGEGDQNPQKVMTEEFVITSRETMRKTPPSILLTNYKMLDYLLVRPGDLPLWRENGPEILRFLVVDELHTFDGAQGTDLACLIRRLKERLKTPTGTLCCVGTSATLGSKDGAGGLVGYAKTVFGEPFDDDAIVTEYRQGAGEFLEDAQVRMVGLIAAEKAPLLDPERHADYESYVRAQHELWLESTVPEGRFSDHEWRVAAGVALKEHPLFQNVLKALRGKTCTYEELFAQLDRATGELRDAHPTYKTHLLTSLLALISEARTLVTDEHGDQVPAPFLRVRLQLWLREMRRMVASVSPSPRLRFADDLSEEQLRTHLPVVHCRDCGAMGWAGTKGQYDLFVDSDLRTFYVAFFGRSPKVVFLFPDTVDTEPDGGQGVPGKLCSRCLRLTTSLEHRACPSCQAPELIEVFHPETTVKRKSGFVGHHHCPYCGGQNALTIVGSRAASLAAVLVSQLYASGYNDDKKLLTFSDSVQDAAHRAGFFAARTFRFNLRAALQQFIAAKGANLSLAEIAPAFSRYWSDRLGNQAAFVATFLPPDLGWLADYEHLTREGTLPEDSGLPRLVDDRIDWEIHSEYGFSSRIGRTLEKTGSSVLHADTTMLERVTVALLDPMRNEVGPLRDLDTASLRRFLVGLLTHLKSQGGILHRALDGYVADRANTYHINRQHWMPSIGPYAQAPVFLTNKRMPRFETVLSGSPKNKTWHQAWAEKCFQHLDVSITAATEPLYELVLNGLVAEGLFDCRIDGRGDAVWGIRPKAMRVSSDVVQLRCRRCGHNVSAARAEADAWADRDGAPCQRFHCHGRYGVEPRREDYYGKLYQTGDVERIFAAEHTGLLKRDERKTIETQFKTSAADRKPWYPNLLSCTPTLELGIDIGDLSSLILCSVPPAQANYLQRIGRTGRRDGNSLNLTIANARPHDLFFFAEPKEMLAGHVASPGVFLEAPAVLERQFTAYCFDRWVESGIPRTAIPGRVSTVLEHLDPADPRHFPHSLLAFIEVERTGLYDRFLQIFDLRPESFAARHLDHFVSGGEDGRSGLRLRVVEGFHRLHKERRSLENNVKLLRTRIKKKEADPAKDKNHARELAELKREKGALQRLAADLGKKGVFEFLSDEGLLPNYAFPEAGVVLKSIIYRKREAPDEDGSSYDNWVYEYERPGASAISELAPENYFYAEGRKVQIDKVNLTVSEIETWRLCRECAYSELVGAKEETAACRRCGDTLWADEGQKRQMLRLRQVFASTADRRSRIGDQHDAREPRFYNRQMLVDFERADVDKAYRIASDELPFGFEFLSKVRLQEINFGERGYGGPGVTVAGVELPRTGFTLCGHCGTVQRDTEREPQHDFTCTARNPDSPKSFTDCVYLYRELTSEAIRILLPISTFSGSDRKLHSFVAALHLGLTKRFEGNIDHLQTTVYDEPEPGSTNRRRYLVLYDTVPGGTGYLKQLMLNEQELLEVFDRALKSLRACPCQQDPSKDGCYRCLFAYRRSYDMKETSRDTAVALLAEVLQHRGRFEPTDTLSNISTNALFDSELEARLVEALRRGRRDDRSLRLKKDVVSGKPGYFLRIGERAYTIEPQVTLGPADGVSIPSKVDFLFRPAGGQGRSASAALPVALFTDGFTWHKARIGKDMAQRMALAQSGRYRVWSLTWQDVENSFQSEGNYFSDPLQIAQVKGPGFSRVAEHYKVGDLAAANRESSFEWLLRFLAHPEPDEVSARWKSYAFVHGMMQIDGESSNTDAGRAGWSEDVSHRLPTTLAAAMLADEGATKLGSLEDVTSDGGTELRLFVALAEAAASDGDVRGMRVAAYLDDTPDAREASDFKRMWTGFLRLFNLFQFVPRAFFATRVGIENGDYEGLELNQSGPATEGARELPPEWREVWEEVEPDARPLLRALAAAGWSAPPIPPYELISSDGETLAEAEFGWPEERVALLTDGQMAQRSEFTHAGWQVVELEKAIADPESHLNRLADRGHS